MPKSTESKRLAVGVFLKSQGSFDMQVLPYMNCNSEWDLLYLHSSKSIDPAEALVLTNKSKLGKLKNHPLLGLFSRKVFYTLNIIRFGYNIIFQLGKTTTTKGNWWFYCLQKRWWCCYMSDNHDCCTVCTEAVPNYSGLLFSFYISLCSSIIH